MSAPPPGRTSRPELSDAAVVSRSWGMALATLVSRLTGFARIVLLAAILGAALSSAFTVANQLPNMIAALVLEATFTAIFVPVLARAERDDPDGGTAFVRRLLTLATTLLLVVTLLSTVAAPLLVERFCRSIQIANGAYAFVACTCGDDAGLAIQRLKRFFPYQSAWSFSMPNNYILGFDTDPKELEQKKVAAARERLRYVSESILEKKTEFDVRAGSGAWLKTAFIRPMFNTFARRTKPFYATNDCNGCGLCERDCPTKAIVLEDGKPVWVRKNCAQCMACINRCPKQAIQYGTGTKSRGRYYFTDK